ncbi:diaminopilmelate decarboxylase protein [Herbaspirillum seropedicae]|nr:diaminopilmelate decarboxylase protein [Herbaspirillum seropedicae]
MEGAGTKHHADSCRKRTPTAPAGLDCRPAPPSWPRAAATEPANPPGDAQATLRMGWQATRSGIDEAQMPSMIAPCQHLPTIRLEGLHIHALSNNLDMDDRLVRVRHYLQLAAGGGSELRDPIRQAQRRRRHPRQLRRSDRSICVGALLRRPAVTDCTIPRGLQDDLRMQRLLQRPERVYYPL